jgi:hypothetical protein
VARKRRAVRVILVPTMVDEADAGLLTGLDAVATI